MSNTLPDWEREIYRRFNVDTRVFHPNVDYVSALDLARRMFAAGMRFQLTKYGYDTLYALEDNNADGSMMSCADEADKIERGEL